MKFAQTQDQLIADAREGLLQLEAERSSKWDHRFLEMAALVASWSKDPSTKCGAVIVRPDKTVCSVGFNGFASRLSDDPAVYANREKKYQRVVHAELNALLFAREPVVGYTMYTWPPGYGATCDRCAAHVIQAGITRVVHVCRGGDFPSRWKEACEEANAMYHEAGVHLVHYHE